MSISEFSAVTNDDWLNLLHDLANQADDIAMHFFEKAKAMSLDVQHKDNMTPVSEGDLAIEKEVRKTLDERFPGLPVLGEEFGACPDDSEYKLIIDPIDGTSNFIRGLPYFACLLALEKHGEIIAGVVSAPATGDRWWACRGDGAYHNGDKVQVSKVDSLDASQAFHGGLFGNEARGDREKLLNLLSKTKRQRGFGDYVIHMLVAMGCGEFSIDFGLQPWDLAPLGIIVQEAGGTVTHVDGSTFSPYGGSILCSNGVVHDAVVEGYC